MLNNKVILITGGTGSFGQAFTEIIFEKYKPKKVIVFSRDEFKQHEMAKKFPTKKYNIRFFIGDIRDKDRLERAFDGIDYVVHAAALKQVPALEYNPMEAVKTNVLGANNIVEAAIDKGVKMVIALSTDKAVNPVNLYGATKLVSEKIFIDANAYGGGRTKFSVVRYGNVVGSRGSVVEHFMDLKHRNISEFPITDKKMTRFWMTTDQSVQLVIKAIKETVGGEIFVPKISSMNIMDLVRAINPKCTFRAIGIRAGEKMHEILVSEDESSRTKIFDGIYVILPQFFEKREAHRKYKRYRSLPANFAYKSDDNKDWLTIKELQNILKACTNI
ncbi:MAG: UDP-N-acetylglucosamine 4,6-dehydratase (inverting) [Candidatus Omnitrophica bacterium]|nr:UDP-N-acetylglucosamine 4,6-dehydratase (inverting) [Candidatus Omnitrophota bacterium]MCG2705297.1 UDP-N-acetylglucosamine 4,6-dehydratase (inverting) [Candidatus Omnitrophota bacterium]